jgi:hypothetical protein
LAAVLQLVVFVKGHIVMTDPADFRRSPKTVMRLARMGSFHPTRLSFLPSLLRWMKDERWTFDRPLWRVDDKGVGHAVYRAIGPDHTYSLVAFAHDLPAEMRSDRVIATAWDATFALFDGTPTEDDLARLAKNVPLQEAGRISAAELSLSRANRSVRLFDHVVARLAEGRQPDAAELNRVGYLMRTTAVYGSGKFGAADRSAIAARPELQGPFRVEMLSVWLTRAFTVDLVEHLARVQGGARAVRLDPDLRRGLGVGNATGLGMAPFLIRHPALLNNWILAREEALARVRAQDRLEPKAEAGFRAALARAVQNAAVWHSDHPMQVEKLGRLRHDLTLIAAHLEGGWDRAVAHPWDGLWRWAEATLSLEGQEQLVALMLEPHGALVDGLAGCMYADEAAVFAIDGAMPLAQLQGIVERVYDWALTIDYDDPQANARFWYVSEDKLEPRMGLRHEDEGAARESPLATGRAAAELAHDLAAWKGGNYVADFLLARPQHRQAVRRAQIAAHHPYAEICDNLIDADMLPIDILRCKLSFFGATRFDPKSDLWVRISLAQDLPYPDEMAEEVR